MASEADRRDPGLQKINVKIELASNDPVDWDLLLEIFGRWRLEEGEEIIDLADYNHVPNGPGVLLVSHRWQFGVDGGDGWSGLFLSTRKGLTGSPEERVRAAFAECVRKSARLLAEKEVPSGVRPSGQRLEITLNDRVRAPNDDATASTWEPAVRALLDGIGCGGWTLSREASPERRAGWIASADSTPLPSLDELLAKL